MSAAVLAWQPGGHEHTLDIGFQIGPLVLRVGVLAGVCAVAGFAMLRGFLPEPSRVAGGWVAGTAAGAVLLELMIAGRLDIPAQAVVLLLAALAAPIFLILSRDPRFTRAVTVARRLAPWMVPIAGGFAIVELARAGLGTGTVNTALLHTGVVAAIVALSWFTVCAPENRTIAVVVQVAAALLANAAIAGVAYAIVLSPLADT